VSIRYGRWEDAMVEQLRLHEWTNSEEGQNYLAYFEADMQRKHKVHERMPPGYIIATQNAVLSEAEPIYVSDDICELVDRARETFEPEAVLPGDPFVPAGFALLARPITLKDAPWDEDHPMRATDGTIPVRAISWIAVHNEDLSAGCFWITYYTSAWDEDVTRWGSQELLDRMRREQALSMCHTFQWTWGENPWTDISRISVLRDDVEEEVLARAKDQVRLIQTMWRIAQQFVPVRERAPRGLWRDAKRKGFDQRTINVCKLRRARGGDAEPTGREVSVRFLVHGHWRNQWYPSLSSHRQIWIHPYVKGPEDAPFKLTERAWEFTR